MEKGKPYFPKNSHENYSKNARFLGILRQRNKGPDISVRPPVVLYCDSDHRSDLHQEDNL